MAADDDSNSQTTPLGKDDRAPCGLYKTTKPIDGKISTGELVYYHNHGDPGPGVYPVEKWSHNKAVFSKSGASVPTEGWERSLEPVVPEGFFTVEETFYCCEDRCRSFEKGSLVQLGYNRKADPLLFTPVWSYEGIRLPKRGTKVDVEKLELLRPVKIVERFEKESHDPGPYYIPPESSGYLQ